MIRGILATIEILILSALILATRCANYQDVFVAGNAYFADADCYARMTRVRMCENKPGLIVRHHDFENFPVGTNPHTTAPFDYLILTLSILLKPFTGHPVDLAGALVSPLLALVGAWFLWWWSRRMKFRYRWPMLILYAISPILVQGTELGRPDHQSLAIVLITMALCAEWTLRDTEASGATGDAIRDSRMASEFGTWSGFAGVAWGFAIWVSAYEPLILFLLVIALSLATIAIARPPQDRHCFLSRRPEWISFVLIIVLALLIERRVPSLTIFQSSTVFKNWARTIGELAHVSPANPIWLRWTGYLVVIAPILIWLRVRKRKGAPSRRGALPIYGLLAATYLLTIWQARWAYFFVLVFAISLPALLEQIKSHAAVWVAFLLSIFPILREWDERCWPNEPEYARRLEQRNESVELRDLALNLRSSAVHPFLAPWWLSPSIAYWSRQPGIAGSSHESLPGIEASARCFLSEDWGAARKIVENRRVAWVMAYDFERVTQNSSAILASTPLQRPICFVLDRTPTQTPRWLVFSAQNSAGKLYRIVEQ